MMTENRTLLPLYAVIVLAAVIATAIVWFNFISEITTNPSPSRVIEMRYAGEVISEPFVFCFGPAYADGDTLWHNCSVDASAGAEFPAIENNTMIRYDMADGSAEIGWIF